MKFIIYSYLTFLTFSAAFAMVVIPQDELDKPLCGIKHVSLGTIVLPARPLACAAFTAIDFLDGIVSIELFEVK